MANLPCIRHDDNKTLSHKIIKGGNMRVGSLVKIRYSNALKMVGKWAIVLETGYENARIYIIDERRTELYANKKLEEVCK